MAEESKNRFHDVMDKLFLASPPNYKSNTKSTTTTASTSASAGGLLRGRKCPLTKITTPDIVDSKFRGGTIEELRNASGGTVQSPMCRPWDREDLLKRLATFKSMTWFAKPELCWKQRLVWEANKFAKMMLEINSLQVSFQKVIVGFL